MEPTFVSIPGFDGKYEISITEPHQVIDTTTGLVLDEWYNGYGEEAVLLDGELYLITELLPN